MFSVVFSPACPSVDSSRMTDGFVPRFVYVDKAMPIEEMAIYRAGVDPKLAGWLPCKFPERPLDLGAAVQHFIKGEKCRPCEIALDAFLKRNQPYSNLKE